ncbi:MBL fold metallo-hydrolase [Lysinibacillus sp. 54212]|uniref:MBL fold metallo-hydrolase n=1 Tax=Lysinibacillus sp. 54212 TaxID=3119829 RepID=UPI002FCB72FA
MSAIIKQGNKTVYPILFEVNYGQMKSINCYLYHDGQTLTLIDGGFRTEKFDEYFDLKLAEYGLSIDEIDRILLTHHHEDHTGQVNRIVERRNIPVYAHHLALERLHFDKTYLQKKRDFFMRLYEDYGCTKFASDRLEKMAKTFLESDKYKLNTEIHPLYGGDSICGMKVIEVPGHSPDSIIFYDEETKWQFVGDLVLNPGSTNALIDFDEDLNLLPTVAQYEQSLLKCQALDASLIFPGHQQPFSNHKIVIDEKLNRIATKCERIVEVIKDGHHQALQIAYAMYGPKLQKEFPLVMSEVIGFLAYAESKQKISKTMKDGEWYFERV